jgi:galactose mutarotase-like enzyme
MIENSKPLEKQHGFNIETFTTPLGSEVSYCAERGIIVSVKFNGQEVLFLDEATLQDLKSNVKGGIPVLFPNAGPIPEELKTTELSQLEQHGFARKQKWESTKTTEGIDSVLRANDETKKNYPYNFELSLISKFKKDGSFNVVERVENLEADKNMPVSFGLHPYFKVSSESKKNIKFNFIGGKFIEENAEKWINGEAVKIDNPNTPMEVIIPGLGTLIFTISPEYKRVWVWSQPGKDFICIEPVMRDKGGIITDPQLVKPREKYSATLNVGFIPE